MISGKELLHNINNGIFPANPTSTWLSSGRDFSENIRRQTTNNIGKLINLQSSSHRSIGPLPSLPPLKGMALLIWRLSCRAMGCFRYTDEELFEGTEIE